MRLWRLPKTESSILKNIVPPLWPTNIGERRTPFLKAYGIKVRWYGERGKFREIGEHSANTLGSSDKWKKNPTSPPQT
jgi:hypothetical protein